MSNLRWTVLVLFAGIVACEPENESGELSPALTAEDVDKVVHYLASDELEGREAGSAGEARAANYIADHFAAFGLQPAGEEETFFQYFPVTAKSQDRSGASDTTGGAGEKRQARNVIGLIEGRESSEEYIVIGAHYDHLGRGAFGSLSKGSSQIHNGADDNASGTAGILELAHYFSEHPPEKNLLFIAFSGEEMGLIGSQYYVDHPTVSLDRVAAMINLDMIGRMTDRKLTIYGTGSSEGWDKLLESTNRDSLEIRMVDDGTGASDHTSFYNRGIPVLHYFTNTHADYHRPSDDPARINREGTVSVIAHVQRLVEGIDTLESGELSFTENPSGNHSSIRMEGVTMGVTPDYGYEGTGMRIVGVRSGGAADSGGLQARDVIIGLNEYQIEDIYDYMEALETLDEGDEATVRIQRDERELEITVRF